MLKINKKLTRVKEYVPHDDKCEPIDAPIDDLIKINNKLLSTCYNDLGINIKSVSIDKGNLIIKMAKDYWNDYDNMFNDLYYHIPLKDYKK